MTSFDPIEAAKLGTPKQQAKQKRQETTPPPAPEGVAPAPPIAEEKVVAPLLSKYRVKADHRISIGGAVTWVAKGQVIDPAGYGADHVKRLLEQGVELEEIT